MPAEYAFRDNGAIPITAVDHRLEVYAYDEQPICFLGQMQFAEWIGKGSDGSKRASVIHEKRCDHHTPWTQGLTPKEHWEMIRERERLEWQANREDAGREFQADQMARAAKFQADESERADMRHKENIKLRAELHKSGQTGDWGRLMAAAVVGAFLANGLPWFISETNKASEQITTTPAQSSAQVFSGAKQGPSH